MESVSYRPDWLLVKSFDTPVSTFVTVTVTSGISAPVGSVTTPRMSPAFVLCAKQAPLPRIRRRGRTHRCKFFMELPPDPVTVPIVLSFYSAAGETYETTDAGENRFSKRPAVNSGGLN